MANEQLIEYIRQQLGRGYDRLSVQNYLIQYGYRREDVMAAFSSIEGHIEPNQKIVEYIKQQLVQGYPLPAIKQALVRYGYPQGLVDVSMNEAVKPKHYHNRPLIFGVIASCIFIVTATIGGFYFLFEQPPTQLLDHKINVITEEVSQGEDLQFIVNLFNAGTRRVDVEFEYLVRDSGDAVVDRHIQTYAVETSMSTQERLSLPSDLTPGRYSIESTAHYSGQRAVALAPFSITLSGDSSAGEDGVPVFRSNSAASTEGSVENRENSRSVQTSGDGPGGDDRDVSGGDRDGDVLPSSARLERAGVIGQENEVPETSAAPETRRGLEEEEEEEELITFSMEESRIRGLSANPDTVTQAASVCSGFGLEIDRDTCYFTLVDVSREQSYCDEIVSNYRRDTCYVTFVLEGNNGICNSIVDFDLRRACEQLSEVG